MAFMSQWYFNSPITVWPFLGEAQWGGGETYGDGYLIIGEREGKTTTASSMSIDSNSVEFIINNIYYTGDPRPKYKDRISYGDKTSMAWDEAESEMIKKKNTHAMVAFGYDDEFSYET